MTPDADEFEGLLHRCRRDAPPLACLLAGKTLSTSTTVTQSASKLREKILLMPRLKTCNREAPSLKAMMTSIVVFGAKDAIEAPPSLGLEVVNPLAARRTSLVAAINGKSPAAARV